MDASLNTTAHHDNFSPLPRPPPTLATASRGLPPLLLLGGPDGSSNLPLPSPDSVSYPPTTATPKKTRPPRRKMDAPLLLLGGPDGSSNLRLPSPDFVSYPPTTATPKNTRPPRRKLDAPLLLLDGPVGSSNLRLPSPDSVSYPPTTATPKNTRPPRTKLDPASTFTPPCTECGKRFSSWKALFGHMRCHPERQWRGVNPPPHFHHSSSPGAAQFSDEEYQVADSLIILANGPPRDCRHKNPRSEGKEREVGGKKAWVDNEASEYSHRCNVCCKTFSSGQALGGHKKSHLKRREAQTGSSSPAKSFVMDLNLPPPMETSESSPKTCS